MTFDVARDTVLADQRMVDQLQAIAQLLREIKSELQAIRAAAEKGSEA